MDLRARFFLQRVVGHSPGSPGNGPCPKAARAAGAFGKQSQAQGGIAGVSVQGQEWDLMILVCPSQLRVFHDSMIL